MNNVWDELDRLQKAGKLVEYVKVALATGHTKALQVSQCGCRWCEASELERKMALALAKE